MEHDAKKRQKALTVRFEGIAGTNFSHAISPTWQGQSTWQRDIRLGGTPLDCTNGDPNFSYQAVQSARSRPLSAAFFEPPPDSNVTKGSLHEGRGCNLHRASAVLTSFSHNESPFEGLVPLQALYPGETMDAKARCLSRCRMSDVVRKGGARYTGRSGRWTGFLCDRAQPREGSGDVSGSELGGRTVRKLSDRSSR